MTTKKKTEQTTNDDFWMVSTGPIAEELTITMVSKTEDHGTAFEAVSQWNDKIKYPVVIRIEDSEGNIVSEDSSNKSTYSKDWSRKFYLKEAEGIKYMQYTRHAVVLALYEIFKATNIEAPKDLRKLKGMKFFGVVNGGKESSLRFINWIETFRANGVDVPELEPKQKEATITVDNTVREIHPDDLPY